MKWSWDHQWNIHERYQSSKAATNWVSSFYSMISFISSVKNKKINLSFFPQAVDWNQSARIGASRKLTGAELLFFTLKWEANSGWLHYHSDSLNCLSYHPTSNYAQDSKVSAWGHLSHLNPLLFDYLRTQSISRHGNRCNWHLGRGSVRVGEHVIQGYVQPSKQPRLTDVAATWRLIILHLQPTSHTP